MAEHAGRQRAQAEPTLPWQRSAAPDLWALRKSFLEEPKKQNAWQSEEEGMVLWQRDQHVQRPGGTENLISSGNCRQCG